MRAPVVALSVPLLLGLLMPVASPPEAPAAPPGVVVFAAGGDHSWGSAFDASLAALASSGTDFYLALGDLSYDVVGTEPLWCADVQENLRERLYVDLVHYTPAMARRVAACIVDQMVRNGL